MGIFGEDGDGYELAARLERTGAWKDWLGAASYAKLLPHLASPQAWHSFMQSSSPLLTLQMRARALLYDKAAECLFLGDNAGTEAAFPDVGPNTLPSSLLQLDANGVYFPLEQDAEDWKRLRASGSPLISSLLAKPDLHALDGSTGRGEDGPDTKGAPVTAVQHRQPSPPVQKVSNMMSSKQDGPRPYLNKVKKVEAWDSFDAKRPVEMLGTINKKLRSPKISNKASFQGDSILHSSSRDHHTDKTANAKNTLGSVVLDEPKYSSTGTGRAGNAAAAAPVEGAESGVLWYDKCLQKHLVERMHRFAYRSAQKKLPFKEQEACLRTAEGMAAYAGHLSGQRGGKSSSAVKASAAEVNRRTPNQSAQKLTSEDGGKIQEVSTTQDFKFFGNSFPDNPVPTGKRRRLNHNTAGSGFLDRLDIPGVESVNSGVTGRFGIQKRPVGQVETKTTSYCENDALSRLSKSAEGSNKLEEQFVQQMVQQTIAKVVAGAGFDGLKQTSMDILCDLLGRRIWKLGSGLKMLVDNYCKRGSQADILKMFVQSTGSSVESLMEHMKAGSEGGLQTGTPVPPQAVLPLGSQSGFPSGSLATAPQMSSPKKRPTATQLPMQQQQMSARQTPVVFPPFHQGQQQQQQQPPFSDKALKRRQLSNLGRSKKFERERFTNNDGQMPGGEARSPGNAATAVRTPMQISPRLHPQQSPWHPQVPLVPSQQGQVLQNYKQQLSSLPQLPSLQP